MPKNSQFKPRKKDSYLRSTGKFDDRSLNKEKTIVFTFIDFDRNQGQTYEDWDKVGLLVDLLNKLSGICPLTVGQAINKDILRFIPK